MEAPLAAVPVASIHAGDLDTPGFPRDLPGRIALLTALVMGADLLLPWVSVNGSGYAPTRIGAPALGLLCALTVVVAPPLIPRARQALLARIAPFGVGAFLLGMGIVVWALVGPLSSLMVHFIATRLGVDGSVAISTPDGAVLSITSLRMVPEIGLYIFLAGACVLVAAGYLTLAEGDQR